MTSRVCGLLIQLAGTFYLESTRFRRSVVAPAGAADQVEDEQDDADEDEDAADDPEDAAGDEKADEDADETGDDHTWERKAPRPICRYR